MVVASERKTPRRETQQQTQWKTHTVLRNRDKVKTNTNTQTYIGKVLPLCYSAIGNLANSAFWRSMRRISLLDHVRGDTLADHTQLAVGVFAFGISPHVYADVISFAVHSKTVHFGRWP